MDSDEKKIFDAAAAAAGLDDNVKDEHPPVSTSSSLSSLKPSLITTPAPSFSNTNLGATKKITFGESKLKIPLGGFKNTAQPSFSGESFSRYRDMERESLSEDSILAASARPSRRVYHSSEHSSALPGSMSKESIQNLQEQIRMLDIQLRESIRLYKLSQHEDPTDAEVMREHIALRTNILEGHKKSLHSMEEIQARNSHRFPIPVLDCGGHTPLKSLLELIPRSNDIYTILVRISETSMNQKLSHSDIRTLLINSLQGDALEVFRSMHDCPLQEVMDALERRFLAKDSISSYNRKIAHFARKKNESLEQAIERARLLIRNSAAAYLPSDRAGRERSLIHSILLRCISSASAQYVSHCEESALKEGKVLTIDELCQIAESIESLTSKDSPSVEFSVENIEPSEEATAEINEATPGILRPATLQAPTPKPEPRRQQTTQDRRTRSRSRDPRDERRMDRESRSRERRHNILQNRRSASFSARDVDMTSPPRNERSLSSSRPPPSDRRVQDVRQRRPQSDFRPKYDFGRPTPSAFIPQMPRYQAPSPADMPYPAAPYWPQQGTRSGRPPFQEGYRGQYPTRNGWQEAGRPMYYTDRRDRGPPFIETSGPLIQRVYCSPPLYLQQSHRNDRRFGNGARFERQLEPRNFRGRYDGRSGRDYGRSGSPRRQGNGRASGSWGSNPRHMRR